MNNDINASLLASVAACSSNSTTTTTTTIPCNAIAGMGVGGASAECASSGGQINTNDSSSITSVTSLANDSVSNISTASPSASATADQTNSAGNDDDKTNKSETWEESRLKDWDYCRFKQLLDEAYSYKNPRDKENKSDIFLQLLDKAEKEKEDHKFAFRALTSLYTPRTSTSNSQKQGGSLQDLVEAVRNDSLDCDYNYGGQRNRRHNHNSRPKKYSSVSSRQREGGSLPSNVNVSNCSLSVYEQPFLNEEPTKQIHEKNEPRPNTTSTTACHGTLPSKNSILALGPTSNVGGGSIAAEVTISTKACSATPKNDFAIVGGCGGVCEGPKGVKGIKNVISLAATFGSATSATCAALATATAVVSGSTDTVVEMNENYIDQHNDLLSQGIQFDRFDGIEMKIPRANIIGSVLTSDFSPNNTTSYVDEAVHFTTLERGKSTVDASLGEKSELVKMPSFSATKPNSKQYDENGNSLNTTFTVNQSQGKNKKKKTQSERNTKTLDVQSVEGYRGSDPIEELVKYIESSEDTKQNEKVNKFADSKKKEKKRDKEKDKEKEKGKIKRSNSLEELRTCSKIDGDDVTMRNKTNIKNKNVDIKDKQIVSSTAVGANTGTNRKGERRSWGTEELTYLGENNAIEEVREKVKDKEKRKSKEKDFSEKLEKVVEKRKKSDSNIVVSMESISCESAEFHVVTKKKKPKKQRQLTEESKNNNCSNSNKNPMYQNRKYHSNFSNDRDAYMGSFGNNSNNDKSRRKSTSSMPPSEKSDSSDLDSVHSLPIESAGGRSPQVHHHQNQPRSYAEIARKTDAAAIAAAAVAAAAAAALASTSVSATITPTTTTTAVVCPTTGGVIESTGSNTSSNNSSHTELEVNANPMPVVNTVTKKTKKSVKNDFPELTSNEISVTPNNSSTTPNISTTVKQISYSQSLTSATGKNEEHAVENVLQVSPPTDVIKTTEKQIQKQPQHQMPLQKSKSVETDSFYNSIDQYPALEKTVKRHSTANACGSDVGGVTATSSPSGTVTLQMNSITSFTTIGNSTPSSNKKSKTNTKASDEVLVEQQHSATKKSKKEKLLTNEHYSSITQSTATTLSSSSTTSSNINNKNQINHNHHNFNLNNNNNNKSSCSNSHNNNNTSNNSNSNNKYTNRPAVIILNDDTTAGGLSSCIGNEFTFGDFNEEELRLFDDNQPPSQPNSVVFQKRYSATTVNATTPQSFDDSGGNFNTTGGSTALDVTNNSDDALIMMQHTSSPNSSLVIDQSSDSGICSNYDLAKGKRIIQQSTGTIITTNRSLSTDALITNTVYLSASTSPSKESLSSSASSSSSTSSNSSASSGTYVLNAPVSKSITLSTSKSSKSKTASFSSPNYNQQKHCLERSKNKTTANSIHCNTKISTMNKRNSQRQHEQISNNNRSIITNCNASTLPSLETCDDIETAIIAAAKKAAAVAAEQTSTSVINKNYNTKGSNNLSAMGSTATPKTTINNINNNKNSNLNHTNSCNSQSGVTSPPSSVFSQNKDIRRGGNSSSNSSVGAGTGVLEHQLRKEIDVHFIQPTLATPISSIQNNETIINFIGSAWEEVANSKVTQFYDGQ